MTDHSNSTPVSFEQINIPLERDLFMRNLIRELSGLLEEMVGLEEASGFISVVAQRMGTQINNDYRAALDLSKIPYTQIAKVLVDFKQRIQGDFYIIEENGHKIVLGNRACPFAEKVISRSSLCMMTSNIFGVVTAENTGYSKVVLENTIAQGHKECRIVIYLSADETAPDESGREYFGSGTVPND